ncbi:MAG: hypothetical protein U0W24_25700 [Bacteroidales bacterium]
MYAKRIKFPIFELRSLKNQQPTFAQNFNRYSYCLNNPLKYTDPSWYKMAALDEYWNLGKAFTAYTSISQAFCPDYMPYVHGEGYVGGGGALPGWVQEKYGNNDYRDFWVGMFNIANNMQDGKIEFENLGDGDFIGYTYINVTNQYNKGTPTYTWNEDFQSYIISPVTIASQKVFAFGTFNCNNLQHKILSNPPQVLGSDPSNQKDKFYESDVRYISESTTASSYFAGAINTKKSILLTYQNRGLNSNAGKHLMHEFGHFLQNKYGGSLWYNLNVVPSSLINFGSDINKASNYFLYNRTWTKVQEITMSYYYFNYPSFWDFKNYPVNSSYISDELKSKLYFHK